MDSIYKSKFWTKCPYCEMEFQYPTSFKNCNRSCPICSKHFTMEDDLGHSELQSQLRTVLAQLKMCELANSVMDEKISHLEGIIQQLEDQIKKMKQSRRKSVWKQYPLRRGN